MLKSPIKLSSRLAAIDVNVPNGSTDVVGIPCVDYHRFFDTDPTDWTINPTNTIGIVGHGIPEGNPIVVTNQGGAAPGGITEGATYWCEAVDADTIKLYLDAPGGATRTFTSQGTGVHRVQIHDWAKYVMITNFGSGVCVVAPCYDESFTISDPDEWPIVSPYSAQAFLLDVKGYKCLAFYGIGATTDVRISPLENY